MAEHNETGKKGEALVVDFLVSIGYEILETNWRAGKAELDIIAKERETLVFVEVKTRSSYYFGAPEEFVTPKKERLLWRAAGAYMEKINYDQTIRFDIVSVVLTKTGEPDIVHFKDAFFFME